MESLHIDILTLDSLFCTACTVQQYLLLLENKPFHIHWGEKRNYEIQLNYAKEPMEVLITFGNESDLSMVA